MQEFYAEIKSTLVQMAIWGMIIIFFLWLSDRIELISGYSFGFMTSVIYYVLMSNRVKKCAELPASKAVSVMRVGWVFRLTFVVCMLLLAVKLPRVNLWAAVAGLFSMHAVLIFQGAAIIIKTGVSQVFQKE